MATIENLANLLHAIKCDKDHDGDMIELVRGRKPGVCYFLLEQSIASEEIREDYNQWKREAEDLCASLSTSPEQTIRIITKVLQIRNTIEDLLSGLEPTARDQALKLLSLPQPGERE